MPEATRVLLTGATGFVGRHLYPELVRAGFDVVCASRDPEAAGRRFPDRVFRRLDVADPESVHAALQGCDAAIYLVHGMGDGGDYEAAEREAATAFRQVAEQRGVRRIVYLGGIRPSGKISKHLRSRLGTGEALRGGAAVVSYAAAQLGTGSLLVVSIALGCGALWTLQRLITGSVLSAVISHAIWTPTVVLLCPVV